ncbi:O-antigen ligase family protein [Patescibacteria group bacterium]|nr:O-antigen ligase family protein [Patescibacteria group bacterium]
MMKKINKFLLFLLILALPWQSRWIFSEKLINSQVWEYGRLSLYASMIILLVLFVCTLWPSISKFKLKAIYSPKMLWVLGSVLYFILVSFFSSLPSLSFYLWFYFLGAAIFIWLLSKQETKLVYFSLLLSAFIQGALAVWQVVMQKIPAYKFLGIAEHLPETLGASVVEYDLNRILRAYGALTHPNVLGGFLALATLAGLWFWLSIYVEARAENWRGPKIKFLVLKLFLVLFALVIIILGLLFSFSRGAILAFILAMLFIFVTSIFHKQYLKLQVVVKMMVLFIILALFVNLLFPGVWQARLQATGDLEQQSISQRLSGLDQMGWQNKKTLFFGQGLGANTYVNIQSSQAPYEVQPIHNVFLLALAELGIVGLLILLNLWRLFFWHGFKKLFNVWLLLFVALAFFDHYLWTTWTGCLMWGLMFYFYSTSLNKKN